MLDEGAMGSRCSSRRGRLGVRCVLPGGPGPCTLTRTLTEGFHSPLSSRPVLLFVFEVTEERSSRSPEFSSCREVDKISLHFQI